MRKPRFLAAVFQKMGGVKLLNRYWGASRLTVLTYHRILDDGIPDFDCYVQNVSTTPDMFAAQMAYISQHFNVISLDDLRAFVTEGKLLPDYPLLITFDDGYLDTYRHALPVLKSYQFPAVVFLTTGFVDGVSYPWWDEVAYYIYHTHHSQANLPLIGQRHLSSAQERGVSRDALIPALKKLPDSTKSEILEGLSDLLQVRTPTNNHELFVSWEQVHELIDNRIACQAHTVSHPILTQISESETHYQLTESRKRIEVQTNQPVFAFAYPNGSATDYNASIMNIVRETNYELAFTMLPGPLPVKLVPERSLEIARVNITYTDTFEIFQLKVMGLSPLLSSFYQRRFG